jgi:hypothetical protein
MTLFGIGFKNSFFLIYFESTISSQIHVSGKFLRIEMSASALFESALLETELLESALLESALLETALPTFEPSTLLGPPGPARALGFSVCKRVN